MKLLIGLAFLLALMLMHGSKPTANSPIAPVPPLCPSDMTGCQKGT